jgi:hypothetical protein
VSQNRAAVHKLSARPERLFTGDVRMALSRDLQIPFSLESSTTLPSPESPFSSAQVPIYAMPPLENPEVANDMEACYVSAVPPRRHVEAPGGIAGRS